MHDNKSRKQLCWVIENKNHQIKRLKDKIGNLENMLEKTINTKPLKTLQEHNLNALRRNNKEELLMNGIACPLCGEELFDSSPGMLLLSSPAQTHIKCPKCVYEGTRFV